MAENGKKVSAKLLRSSLKEKQTERANLIHKKNTIAESLCESMMEIQLSSSRSKTNDDDVDNASKSINIFN